MENNRNKTNRNFRGNMELLLLTHKQDIKRTWSNIQTQETAINNKRNTRKMIKPGQTRNSQVQ